MASHFKSLDAIMAADATALQEAEEVGDKIAQAIIEYFADPVNLAIIERLRAAGLKFESEQTQRSSDILEGKNVVVSGKFTLHSREELKALIERHGGKNQSGVSSNTDFIVAGENMGPAKLQKAEKLGVTILSEQQFIELLGDSGTAPLQSATAEPQPKAEQVIQTSLF
jgi:DNA ligase (NAD+)